MKNLEKMKKLMIGLWISVGVVLAIYALLSDGIGNDDVIATLISFVFVADLTVSIVMTINYSKEKKAQAKLKIENDAKLEEQKKLKAKINDVVDLFNRDDKNNLETNLLMVYLDKTMDSVKYPFDVEGAIKKLKKESIERRKCSGDYIALDFETTGLNPDKDRIIQIAAIKFENFEIVDKFSTYVNPDRHIPAEASNINGIYDGDVESAPYFKEICPELISFIGESLIVAHNCKFDYSFLQKEYKKATKGELSIKHECTMEKWRREYWRTYGHAPVSSKLSQLACSLLTKEEYKNYIEHAHDADADALACGLIWQRL